MINTECKKILKNKKGQLCALIDLFWIAEELFKLF